MSKTKKIMFICAGVIALCVGAWMNIIVIQGAIRMRLNAGTLALCLISAVMMWMGFRAIKLATSPNYASRARVTLWKVSLGALIVYSAIHSHFFPASNMLKANNVGEETGMVITTILITVLGLWLIVSGIKTKMRPPQQT